jgi:hypothetical protein
LTCSQNGIDVGDSKELKEVAGPDEEQFSIKIYRRERNYLAAKAGRAKDRLKSDALTLLTMGKGVLCKSSQEEMT